MKNVNRALSLFCAVILFGSGATAQNGAAALKARVQAALDPYYTYQLDISTDENGKVTINGDVDIFYDKLNIFELVSKVTGVKEIADLVNVDTPDIPDEIIDANITRGIRDNSVILEPDDIEVTVTDGFVILSGSVNYFREKLMAETIASSQDGVKGVENDIDALPSSEPTSDESVKSIIDELIKNRFPLMRDMVAVKIDDGRVTIDGEANTLWEINNLPRECMLVRGVKGVEINLKLKASI